MKIHRLLLLLAGIIAAPAPSFATDIFSFAGYTFNQTFTPDRASLLGTNAVLGGATFSAGLPTTATTGINFPQSAGFNYALSLGNLTGLATAAAVHAVNLPNGNNGTST